MRPDPGAAGTRRRVSFPAGLPGAGLALLLLAVIAASVAAPLETCRADQSEEARNGYSGPCRALALPRTLSAAP